LRFRRCDICESIATLTRVEPSGLEQQRCSVHAEGDGWAQVCSVEGCGRRPMFKVDYRMGDKRARMTSCPEHFHVLPDDISEVFRID
jgi:hypothetical protein